MKFLASFALLLSLLCNTVSVAFAAPDIPNPVGDIYVQDFAHLLNDQEKADINQMSRKLDDETKAQVAILTVNSLGNSDVEEYANEAFRKYKLGDKKLNNGVLILLAKKDRKIRIEVGYGLEGAITDIKSGEIIDSYAIPNLKNGKYDTALETTYKAVYNQVVKEYDLGKDFEQKVPKASPPSDSGVHLTTLQTLLIAAVIVGLLILDFVFFKGAITQFLLNFLVMFGGRGRGGGSGSGPRGGGGGSSGGGGASRGW
ncbi:TPM domain-containing protein [Priestia aryabhattai]|uniref:TPM domain-containing protein n=1 Tax=Priestia aryabhattai TaxID=412384 RepID=UPI003983520C